MSIKTSEISKVILSDVPNSMIIVWRKTCCNTARIQFDMRTMCQAKNTDLMTTNMTSIELYYYAVTTLILMYLILFEYQY